MWPCLQAPDAEGRNVWHPLRSRLPCLVSTCTWSPPLTCLCLGPRRIYYQCAPPLWLPDEVPSVSVAESITPSLGTHWLLV